MSNTNNTLALVSISMLLTACSNNRPDREETPVEIRKYNVTQVRNLYTVRNGDTVGSIATAHGVKREDLIKANNLTPPYKFYDGQRLIIPTNSEYVGSENLSSAQVQDVVPSNVSSSSEFTSDVEIVQKGGLEVEDDVVKPSITENNQTRLEQSNDNSSERLEEDTSVKLGSEQELVEYNEAPAPTATYTWPVANGRSRISKTFDSSSGNILISTPGRTPVKAIADGVVKMAGKSGNEQLVRFGNMIVIQHKDLEKVSIYANVIDLKVKAGQTVSSGDIIASVSQSGIRGMTTNPALYFEIDKTTNGKKRKPIDPCDVLP